MSISSDDKKVLAPLLEGPRVVSKNGETHAWVKALIKRGYIVLVDALSGPLQTKTGEKMAMFTEAGKIAYESQVKADKK